MEQAAALQATPTDLVSRAALRRWPATRLEAVEPLAGDASARRYVRLHLRGGDAPRTAVAMLLPPEDALRSEELTGKGAAPRELPFLDVQRYLAAHAIAVPELLDADVPGGVLLLEDVGDLCLARAAATAGRDEARELLLGAADTLAAIAALGGRPDPRCCAFTQRYDRHLIGLELDVVSSHGLAAQGGPPRPAGCDPEADRALARLGDAIAAQPTVLMHRDYHAWNLHVDGNGRLRVIDFQDALLGPALYDLASLCTDRDSQGFVSPHLETELVARFASQLARRGGPTWSDARELRRDYLQAVAYRTLRVIGRFRFLAMEKGKPDYLRFLAPMASQTRRALDELGDRELLALLEARSSLFA